MKDPISKLRSATRRAKSDVANKLVSMCLHELSRRVSQRWPVRVDSDEYENLVRERFNNRCPYCSRELTIPDSVVEHLDGMNRTALVALHTAALAGIGRAFGQTVQNEDCDWARTCGGFAYFGVHFQNLDRLSRPSSRRSPHC